MQVVFLMYYTKTKMHICYTDTLVPSIFFFRLRITYMYAGIKKASANNHANGLPNKTNTNQKTGTRTQPASPLAAISHTPAKMAKAEYPSPCIINRTIFTNASKIYAPEFPSKNK